MILSTSWGGDLETFVKQASQRGLTRSSTFVLPLGESSLQGFGKSLGAGHIIGGRGDHYFLHPEKKNDPEYKKFVDAFKARTGAYPIYPVFHVSQALAALKAAYEKAIAANGGQWPDREQVVDAMTGLTFAGLGRPVTIRADGQGVEDQLLGTSVVVDGYDFPLMDDMMIFDGDAITTPVGQLSAEWLKTLTPAFINSVPVETFSH